MFKLGRLFLTPAASKFCEDNNVDLLLVIKKHLKGEWEMDAEDVVANHLAIRQGDRVFGAFKFPAGKLWVITEADRGSTTILLPEDY